MPKSHLTTVQQVIDALAGVDEVMAVTKVTIRQQVTNWLNRGQFPGWTAVPLLTALQELGYTADATLWPGKPKTKEFHKDPNDGVEAAEAAQTG